MTMTKTNTLKEHLQRTILVTCDIWDNNYNSENWEPEFMTIFVAWQLRVTLDSIHNSCDVLFVFVSSLLLHTVWSWLCWQRRSLDLYRHKRNHQLTATESTPTSPKPCSVFQSISAYFSVFYCISVHWAQWSNNALQCAVLRLPQGEE